jgi:predicted dehydrogenase
MRIAAIGVSHWHTRLYLNPVLEMADATIVGVSDPDSGPASEWAEKAACPAFADYREMCEVLRPDFVFALGKHVEMAAIAAYLVEARIPFAMEKPCGMNYAEIDAVARRAAELGTFAGSAFVMRHSKMIDTIREVAPGEAFHYMSCCFIGGLAGRYPLMNSAWMLDKKLAGGGAMTNLGIHAIDLCNALLGPGAAPVVTSAAMSNSLAGYDVEDYGLITMKAGRTNVHVESGYAYPGERGVYDMHLTFRTDRHYFIAHDAETFEVVDDDKNREIRKFATTNMACYPVFVSDVLRRVRDGEPPIADMRDAAATMKILETAYGMAGPLG